MGFDWTTGQKLVLSEVPKWYRSITAPQIFTIAGYAGTGKTTIVSEVIKSLDIEANTRFAAYTGKAATMLTMKGNPAVTIHNLIYNLVEKHDPFTLKRFWDFEKKPEIDPSIDLIVIDEISMVDDSIMTDLMSFNKKILVLGDPFQLPPVPPKGKEVTENRFMVNPDAFLTEITRQAENSPIIRLSMYIRNKLDLEYICQNKSDIFQEGKIAIIDKKDLKYNYCMSADQVLCGKNETRKTYNNLIRQGLGYESELPVVGDKVVCLKNNWKERCEGYFLMNGTLGTVTNVGGKDLLKNTIKINFQADFLKTPYEYLECWCDWFTQIKEGGLDNSNINRFDYGYVITTHKSQGSEWDKVLLLEETLRPQYHNRWLYTGVTRAKEKLMIVKEEKTRKNWRGYR